jgi:hypothetical protein
VLIFSALSVGGHIGARGSLARAGILLALLLAACSKPEGLSAHYEGGVGDVPARFDTGTPNTTGSAGGGGEEVHPTLLILGAQCTSASECESAFCADGVCCNSACDGTCTTCAAANSLGTCVPADIGTDPRDQCPDEGVASCGRDGVCDGAGACRKYAVGSICSAGSCTGSTMTLASRCTADGTCPAPMMQPCDPFICGANGVCQTVCSKNEECTTPNTCIATSCGKKPLGGACTAADECLSGLCEQGTCCKTECKGVCRSCGLAGTQGICSLVATGQDPLGQCADSGAETCGLDGTCDGTGACRKFIAGTSCAPSMCMAANERGISRCDGAGVCNPGVVRPCSPFMCGGTGTCATGCTTAADCSTDYSCIGGACKKKAQGAACTGAAECGTGVCQQGLCCDKLCPGPCQACNLAGAEGVCSMVPAGQDPMNQCTDEGAASCGNDGACSGNGACRKYTSGTVCAVSTCSGTTFTNKSSCDGKGVCVAPAAGSCVPYQCNTGGVCFGTCTTNAQCSNGNLCLNGSCGKKGLGGTCTATTDCMSGFCEQGICCGSTCTGTCQSCAVPGKEGTCSPVPAGQDPLNQCADQGAMTCGTDGACDGAGACEQYAAGTTCAPQACTGETYTQSRTCNGTGICMGGIQASCGTYACDTNGTCRQTCSMDTHCAAGYVCNSGVCSKKLNGAGCGMGNECQSGQCQQGVCCASSCTGTCRSCAMAGSMGTCALVGGGQDPLNQCADQGAMTCGTDGMCDGAGACRLYAAATPCGATTCSGSTFTSAPTCNGSGVCQPGTQSSCTPYVCGATTCKNSCTSATDCVSPNPCGAGKCGKFSNGTTCMADTDCQSGVCAQGVCCATACGGTCQACNQAGSLGTCKVVPAGQDPLNQCADGTAATCGNDGTCDGAGACRKYAAGTVCVPASCSMSTFTPSRTCNGTGTCGTSTAANCGRYVCNASGCITNCTSNADCASPLLCSGGFCSAQLINCGGPVVQSWIADAFFTGGALNAATNAAIDLTGVTNPAPQAVYQTGRVAPGNNLSYTVPGFTAGSSHVVRLHFCETYWPPAAGAGAGNRICNITINGTQVLTNFDIFAAAGAKFKAVVRPFTVNANAGGNYVIQFSTVKDQCLINGIEIQ